MEFGAHLPLMDVGGHRSPWITCSGTPGQRSGWALTPPCVNDHLVFAVPCLDSVTAHATVIEASGRMTLATTVALVVARGPGTVAKALATVDRLSGGDVLLAVGPGSSAPDHYCIGLSYPGRVVRS